MPVLASVVIDNFDYGRFLPDAIESALAQAHAPVEVVVVDDGSTDGSRDVIARYPRHVLERLLPVPEDIRMCADGYMYELAPLYGRVARLPDPGGTLRKHPSWFGGALLDARLERTVRVHRHVMRQMAKRARELGREPDEAGWAARSWPLRQERALRELDAVVPAGAPFVLIDEGRFGLEPTPRRAALPLPAGLAEDAALDELERARAQGAAHLVVAWPGFPWLERARAVAGHLRSAGEVALENERLLVFALR